MSVECVFRVSRNHYLLDRYCVFWKAVIYKNKGMIRMKNHLVSIQNHVVESEEMIYSSYSLLESSGGFYTILPLFHFLLLYPYASCCG